MGLLKLKRGTGQGASIAWGQFKKDFSTLGKAQTNIKRESVDGGEKSAATGGDWRGNAQEGVNTIRPAGSKKGGGKGGGRR